MKVRIIAKSIALIVIVFFYKILMNFVEPIVSIIIANDLAMNQMQNITESNIGIQLYSYVRNNAWIGLVILAIILFFREALEIIGKLMSKREKNNEEY